MSAPLVTLSDIGAFLDSASCKEIVRRRYKPGRKRFLVERADGSRTGERDFLLVEVAKTHSIVAKHREFVGKVYWADIITGCLYSPESGWCLSDGKTAVAATGRVGKAGAG